jgi:hypothetical protein
MRYVRNLVYLFMNEENNVWQLLSTFRLHPPARIHRHQMNFMRICHRRKFNNVKSISYETYAFSMTHSSQLIIVSRLPMVRFVDEQHIHLRKSNSQHLTCIQNVLSQNHNHPSRLYVLDHL